MGQRVLIREIPPGGMWRADWWPGKGPDDGAALMVQTPGGEWMIDGQASNCDRPNDPHFCWVRHGVPPDVTVDKVGDTCGAGASSVLTGTYHGFLRAGFLESC